MQAFLNWVVANLDKLIDLVTRGAPLVLVAVFAWLWWETRKELKEERDEREVERKAAHTESKAEQEKLNKIIYACQKDRLDDLKTDRDRTEGLVERVVIAIERSTADEAATSTGADD